MVAYRSPLLPEVEAFLAETGMTPTRFGNEALKDPLFVPQLRTGRDPGGRVMERVREFMRSHRADAPADHRATA